MQAPTELFFVDARPVPDDIDSPIGFERALRSLGLSPRTAAHLFGTTRHTIAKWCKPEGIGPNPAAVELLRFFLMGLRPNTWPGEI